MSIKAVLFDLDGTLLPMDQEEFIRAYFGGLAAKLVPHGYDPEKLTKAIWYATGEMIKNDSGEVNQKIFWKAFSKLLGDGVYDDEPLFDEFYHNGFQKVKEVCGYNENAAKFVHFIKEKGIRTILATNPLFPSIATESRIRWAGLEPEDFEYYTTYENSGYCKPNLKYYGEILSKTNLRPQECLMVGNDVGEDMVTLKLGMKVFLLTDNLINKTNEDINNYPNGSFAELEEYFKSLI